MKVCWETKRLRTPAATKKLTLGCVSVIALAVVAPSTQASPLSTGRTACTPGMHRITIDGKPGYQFCGPAKAVAHVGAHTVSYAGGFCRVFHGYFQIGIGKEALGLPPGSEPDFFSITTHKATPGPQPNAAIAVNFGGQSHAVSHQLVKLAQGLKSGTFSGLTFSTHLKVTGSFRC